MRFTRGTKRMAVLGCGPTGLFAAHGLRESGHDVYIFSRKRKSEMFGAQYLHSPIPGLTETDPVTVRYLLKGSADDYRAKVYGDNNIVTSVEQLDREHPAWDIREAYDNAWDRYQHTILNFRIDHNWLKNLQAFGRFHTVVSTIPLPALCFNDGHQFHSAKVWAMGDAPERGQRVVYRPDSNTVECNGERDTGWYRASNIFGYATVEWPGARKPPLPGVAEVSKPLWTDCNCFRSHEFGFNFVPLGRYGQWTKGVLSHHGYTQAAQL